MTENLSRRGRPMTLAIAALLAVALAATSAPAAAASLACGATITANTTLHADLRNCPNDGLVIGADNITLDLNGHRVSGDGAPVASCPDGAFCDVGIDNTAGHSGVTIRNGAIRRFDVGLFAIGGSGNRIYSLSSASQSSFGIIVGDSSDSRLDHDSSTNDGVSGILVFDSQRLRIDHNSITGTSGYAVPVFGSSRSRFDHNVLMHDQHGFLLGGSDQNAGSNNDVVEHNRLSNGPSIEVAHSSDDLVRDNRLSNPGDGILLIESQRARVRRNTIERAGVGFPEGGPGGFGILLDGADDNVLVDNTLSGGKGPAIFVTSLESLGTSDRNLVSHNRVSGNLGDGILVDHDATETVLERNAAHDNGDDGFDVAAVGTTLAGNAADHNHDLGIEAVAGVTDGGSNRAAHNGNPLQCTNIAC
jgi:nitrous oxidase accessory protein NosD